MNAAAAGPIYRRIARNSAYLVAGTATASLFAMLAVAATVRALSPREFGVLVLLQSTTMILAAIMSFSTQQAIIKLGSDAQAAADKDRLGRILSMGLMLDLASSLLAFAAAMLLIGVFGDRVGLTDPYRDSAGIFAFSLLLSGYSTSNGIFRLFNRFGLLSLIQAGSAAALLAGTAVLFVLDAPFEAFAWTWGGYLALLGQLQLWTALALVRRERVPLHFSASLLPGGGARTFMHYCWTTWGMASADTLRANGDSLIAGALVSVEAAGLYNVAKQLAGVLRKLNMVYASALFPEITRLSAQGAIEGARRLKQRMLRIGLLTGFAAIVGALLLGQFVIQLLFGPELAASFLPLIVLTAAAAAQMMSHISSMYVQVYAGPARLLLIYVAAVAAFAVTAFPLTLAFSITGTALAQLVYALVLVMLCNLALRGTHVGGGAGDAA